MQHTLLYLGRLEQNIATLSGGTSDYLDSDGNRRPADRPSEKADGIHFGYMQRSDAFFAVRVGALVLRAPVLLEPGRHSDGKGFGPQASLFGDDSAARLLVDAAIANPEYRDIIATLIRGLSS